MKFRILTVLIALGMCISFFNCSAYAGSMLTSSSEKSDGLVIIGEKINEEDVKIENKNKDKDLYITLKHKMSKSWAKKAQNIKINKRNNKESKYRGIFIRYNHKKRYSRKSSYRYRHKYSSRHKGRRYSKHVSNYLNITPIILREAKRNKISPVLLKAVIQTESNFNPYAVSYAGAMGLGQLMPRTARLLGVRNPFHPEQNIKGTAKYLGKLKRMFRRTELILAAYNAGPGTVRRAGGVPNIYQTRRYIIKVKRNMRWKKK